MSAHHGYEALAPGSIRVVQIQPGRRGSPLRCHLQTHNLQTDPDTGYIALSYACGSRTCQFTLFLNGRSFPVNPNLHSALQHIRDRRSPVLLWVDAICINQSDSDERGSQVAQMRSIYRSARLVTIWLGEADRTSDTAMDHIRYGAHGGNGWPEEVLKLFHRSWWTRVWVIQEAASARHDPVVRCGDKEIPWSRLRLLTTKVPFTGWMQFVMQVREWTRESPYPNFFSKHIGAMAHAQMFIEAVDRFRSGVALSWIEFLAMGYIMESSDPRDLVYALLGLLPTNGDSPFVPNYHKDAGLVQREAAAWSLQYSGGLDTLALTSSLSHEHLPTWVPDLARGEPGVLLTAGTTLYRASGDTKSQLRWSDDHKILYASGIVCDTIVDAVDIRSQQSGAAMEAFDDFDRAKHLAYDFGERIGLDSDTTKECFWRTMIVNQGRSTYGSASADLGYPAPQHLGQRYMAWQKETEVPSGETGDGDPFEWRMKYIEPYFTSLHAAHERGQSSFFTTTSARFGLGQKGLMAGDQVCIFCGGRAAYILRKEQDHHIFVGCAYVHGIMDGEIAAELNIAERLQDFAIH